MKLADLRCERCGSAEVFAVLVGEDGEEVGDLLFTLRRGTPPRAWCLPCWLSHMGIQPPTPEIKQ